MGNPWAYDFTALGRSSPLLVVIGSDRELPAKASGGFRLEGTSDVYKLLPESLRFEQLNLSKQFMKQNGRVDVQRYECVLNLVTDPDLHPKTLESLRKLLRGYRGRVINRPEAVVRNTRDQVAKLLTGIEGLHVPKVLRLRGGRPEDASRAVERAGLSYPLIVRRTGTHTGQIVGIVDDAETLKSAVLEKGDYFATEFVDLREADGLFRKYRVYFFGNRLVFRNQYISDQWNVHSKDHRRCIAERPAIVAQLEAMFARPEGAFPESVLDVFAEVRQRIPQDFFGMDFGLASDGRPVLFEANATMSVFPSWPDKQFRYSLPLLSKAFTELVVPNATAASHPIATAGVKN